MIPSILRTSPQLDGCHEAVELMSFDSLGVGVDYCAIVV